MSDKSDTATSKGRELAIVGLVSSAHFCSHFYLLAIPSALPLVRAEFGVSNVMLGLVLGAYSLMGAVWQFPAGIVSDRYGATRFMIGGLVLLSLAMFFQSMAPFVWVMVILAGIAGFADSVFHPADYTIITAKVRQEWLGKSYAFHTFAGFMGSAAAPTAMSLLIAYADWRFAMAMVGGGGFVMAMILLICRKLFVGTVYAPIQAAAAAKPGGNLVQFLLAPPLLMMFLFYLAATLAGSGIQSFGNSALIAIYSVNIVEANTALAVYLWGSTAGVLIGGLFADRFKRFDLAASIGYFGSAAALCFIGFAAVPFIGVLPAFAIAGFMVGAVMPARDLAVRAVAPAGGIGKAFGYVSSAFGVGGVIGPLFYGTMMDMNMPQLIFFVSAAMMLVTIAMALAASWTAKRAVTANSAALAQAQPAE